MNEYINKLTKKKIEINWNKNPIKMELFLSFLTVEVVKSNRHLGSDTGWTRYNGENNLQISGGVVRGVEYLDTLKYKENLDNRWNDFVNPFHLFDILNNEGKKFFFDYYKEEIDILIEKSTQDRINAENALQAAIREEKEMAQFWNTCCSD